MPPAAAATAWAIRTAPAVDDAGVAADGPLERAVVRPGRGEDGSSAVSSAVSSSAVSSSAVSSSAVSSSAVSSSAVSSSAVSSAVGSSVVVSSSKAEVVERRDVPVALSVRLSSVAVALSRPPVPVPVGRTSTVTPALCPHTKCETVPSGTLLTMVMQLGAEAAVHPRARASLAHAGSLSQALIEAEAMHVVKMAQSSMAVPVQQPNQLLGGS
jgi:hypothetical protein